MSDERIDVGPDEDVGLEQIWIGGQPVGKAIQGLNKRVSDLEKENRELRQENERLTERVAELEANVDPDPTSKDYDEMDQKERVRKIRETLADEAQRTVSGKAQMKYKDVQRIMENRPSAGYAYKLMRRAGEAEGFEFIDDRPKRIRVDSEGVKDETLFHTANKEVYSGAD